MRSQDRFIFLYYKKSGDSGLQDMNTRNSVALGDRTQTALALVRDVWCSVPWEKFF